MSSPQSMANGSSPTTSLASSTAWPLPSGAPWRTKTNLAISARRPHLFEQIEFAGRFQAVLQLEEPIEMILDGAFGARR